jgi:protein-disulfide isomerase
MNRRWLLAAAVAIVVMAFIGGAVFYKGRSAQQVAQAVQAGSDALVRAHAPVYGNAGAKVTIVEFLDPACETTSFGQVRLVVRYAPLHQGSDTAIKILEAARLQGKYWQALEGALADQPRWAAHHNPRPELIWESIANLGLDLAKARADADSPAIAQVLKQDIADMTALKVTATPGFFVNGRPLQDFGAAQLKALVDEELAKAKSP